MTRLGEAEDVETALSLMGSLGNADPKDPNIGVGDPVTERRVEEEL